MERRSYRTLLEFVSKSLTLCTCVGDKRLEWLVGPSSSKHLEKLWIFYPHRVSKYPVVGYVTFLSSQQTAAYSIWQLATFALFSKGWNHQYNFICRAIVILILPTAKSSQFTNELKVHTFTKQNCTHKPHYAVNMIITDGTYGNNSHSYLYQSFKHTTNDTLNCYLHYKSHFKSYLFLVILLTFLLLPPVIG